MMNNIEVSYTRGYRKYCVNHNYFERIDSEDKAYFLGFIFADGCVCLSNNNFLLSLQIHKNDIEILEKFKIFINSNSPLKLDNRNAVSLKIYSKQIVKDLINLGCVERKSLILKFPSLDKIPHNLLNHFMRGYFDGDGSLKISKRKSYNKIKIDTNHLKSICVFSVASTFEFCLKYQEILTNFCGLNKTKIHKSGNIFELCYCGKNNIKRVFDFLYTNANIYLKRKHDRFLESQSNQNNSYKIKPEQVKELLELLKNSKYKIKDLAVMYNVDRHTISKYRKLINE